MSKQIELPKHDAAMANFQGREGIPPAAPTQVAEKVPPVAQVVNGRTIKGE